MDKNKTYPQIFSTFLKRNYSQTTCYKRLTRVYIVKSFPTGCISWIKCWFITKWSSYWCPRLEWSVWCAYFDMISTPVKATVRYPYLYPPEASAKYPFINKLNCCPHLLRLILSSIIMSTPHPTASFNSFKKIPSPLHLYGGNIPSTPAYSVCNSTCWVAIRIVFDQNPSERLNLWLWPPPALTAYLSNTRSPGTVFLRPLF